MKLSSPCSTQTEEEKKKGNEDVEMIRKLKKEITQLLKPTVFLHIFLLIVVYIPHPKGTH